MTFNPDNPNEHEEHKESGITMCPYCRRLFDIRVGNKFKTGEIEKRWGEHEQTN